MEVNYNEAIKMVGHITEDIKILQSFSYTEAAKFEPYGRFEHNTFYNDDYLEISYYRSTVGEDTYYTDARLVGTHFIVRLKKDNTEVFNTELIDINVSKPKASINTYRPGHWEEYLHEISQKYKIKLDEIEEEKERYRKKKEAEAIRKKTEEEYQKTLRFTPIDDRNFFK